MQAIGMLGIGAENTVMKIWEAWAEAVLPPHVVANPECTQYRDMRLCFHAAFGLAVQITGGTNGNMKPDDRTALVKRLLNEAMHFQLDEAARRVDAKLEKEGKSRAE